MTETCHGCGVSFERAVCENGQCPVCALQWDVSALKGIVQRHARDRGLDLKLVHVEITDEAREKVRELAALLPGVSPPALAGAIIGWAVERVEVDEAFRKECLAALKSPRDSKVAGTEAEPAGPSSMSQGSAAIEPPSNPEPGTTGEE